MCIANLALNQQKRTSYYGKLLYELNEFHYSSAFIAYFKAVIIKYELLLIQLAIGKQFEA